MNIGYDNTTQVAANEKYLKSDELISHHLDILYDKMLEGNLLKIINPFRYIDDSDSFELVCFYFFNLF